MLDSRPFLTTSATGGSFDANAADSAFSRQIETPIATIAILAIVATGIFGTNAAAIFIAAAMLLVGLRPLTAGRELLRFWPLLLLPIFAIVSTLWSDAPVRTLRAALQLMLTCIASIIVCRRLDPTWAILTLFIGYVVVCCLALPAVPASLAAGSPLIGPFGSKNQMGFAAHLLFALALAVMVDRDQPGVARLVAIGTAPLGLAMMVLSNSGGAAASAGITLLGFPALVLFGRLPRRGRLIVLLLLLFVLTVGALFQSDIEAAIGNFRETVLKKDATLTGRTYLWDYANNLSRERPWLGLGYYAFWRHGNLGAEGLWRWGGIGSRTGFNFHNAFIEMRVDLGWIGLAILVLMCAGIAIVAGYRQFTRPTIPMAFFLAYLAVMFARTFTETGLIAPFSGVTMFFLAAAVYARASDPVQRSEPVFKRHGPVAARGALPARRSGRQDRQSRDPAEA
jgi:exopolysaccharide production protein ExoQ